MSRSYEMAECYSRLDQGQDLSEIQCQLVSQSSAPDFQLASLAIKLLYKNRNAHEESLLTWIVARHPSIRWITFGLFAEQFGRVPTRPHNLPLLDEQDMNFLSRIKGHDPIGLGQFIRFLTRYLTGYVPKVAMASMLALICSEGLGEEDTTALTLAMVQSGDTFDYRPFANRYSRRILRRYPTGGVSEKIALILPSVLVALSKHLPILTTTLVGRSLGFTGGTWDKLSVIPGFTFPEPGEETERVLAECNAAMCTTGTTVDPADQELYVLRSMTGTIASEPLIVSSIASKHLALPPHRILLDIRFGAGAFLDSRKKAESLNVQLGRALNNGAIDCSAIFLDTAHPTGTSVGNALEVLEAMAVMGNRGSSIAWNQDAINLQRELVIQEVVHLCSAEFPDVNVEELSSTVNGLFAAGTVFDAFCSLLHAHSVSDQDIESLSTRPDVLLAGLVVLPIPSTSNGRLIQLDQVRLGNIVGFRLAPPGDTAQPGTNRAGVHLDVDIGSRITAGDPLCTVYLDPKSCTDTNGLLPELQQCFLLDSKS